MARYVMLEFDDDAEAVAFVKAAQEGVLYYTKPHPTLPKEVSVNQLREGHRVRGLWFKPTKFCECGVEKNTPGAFVKGSKFGVYVHRVCKRPAKQSTQWPKNLLDPVNVPGAAPRAWLHVVEPSQDNPDKLGVSQLEPTPKGELDRVQKNLDSLS